MTSGSHPTSPLPFPDVPDREGDVDIDKNDVPVDSTPSRTGFTIFHSPHEFLFLRDTDERMEMLTEQVKSDAENSSLPWYRKMVSIPVRGESIAIANSWMHWAALLFALLSFLAFASQLFVLPAVATIDFDRLCVEQDTKSFAYAWVYEYGAIAGNAMGELAVPIAGLVNARVLGGFRPWWRLYSRHIVHMLFISFRPLLVVVLTTVALYGWTEEYVGFAYAILMVASLPVVDIGLETHRFSWTVYFGLLGIVATFLRTWVGARFSAASCGRLNESRALRDVVRVTIFESNRLLYSITVVGIVLRRVIRPRRPFCTSPRTPYVSTYGDGPKPFVPYEVRFGKFGFSVFPVGSNEAIAHRESQSMRGKWIIERERSKWADMLGFACSVMLMLSYLAQAISFSAAIGTTANVDLRCFDDVPSALSPVLQLLGYAAIAWAVLFLLCGLWSWQRAVRSPWRRLGHFLVRWWMSQSTFVISAVCYTALVIPSGDSLSIVPIGSVFLFPLVAAGFTTGPRYIRAFGPYFGTVGCVAALLGHAYVTLYSSNLRSTKGDRRSIAVFVMRSLARAADSIWFISRVKVFAKKIPDGTHPMLVFQLEPGIGHENHWLEDAGIIPAANARLHRAASVVLRSRLRSSSKAPAGISESELADVGVTAL